MIGVAWHGTDGSVWDLVNGDVALTPAGIKGLGAPIVEDQTRRSATAPGQTLIGWRLAPREVWLPLRFRRAAEYDVTGIQAAFWASMPIGVVGELRVTRGDGTVRRLGLRFKEDGGRVFTLDPAVLSLPFGITMIADRPWWEGDVIEYAYTAGGVALDFFNGNAAPPFQISPSSGSDARAMTNPGDAPAWVEWEIQGPTAGFQVGVNGHHVVGPFTVLSGSVLTIESDPLRQIALLNGTTRVTRQLTSVDWAPIPSRSTLPVEILMNGTGLVTARITPRYERAL